MLKKKFGACALALATAAAVCVPGTALADPVAVGTSEMTAAGDAASTITGTITATKLSVSVPTTAAFTIDPTITATNDAAGVAAQLTNVPTDYTVTNSSAVPVYAYISNCAISATDGTPALVTKADGLTADKAVMFAVKDAASKPANFATEADWLTTAAGKYYAFNAAEYGKLATPKAATAAGDSSNAATMSFYGQTTTGWSNGDTFTIVPTFTITATAPETTPAP